MAGVKNNRRTKYTIDVIKSSFLTLLRTKKMAQITVTEICKLAEINRGTFYLHYKDHFELLEVMQKDFNREILETMRRDQTPCTADGSLIKLLKIIQEKKMIYKLIISDTGEHSFLSEVLLEAHNEYSRRTEDGNKYGSAVDYSFTYMVYGCMGVINQWLESESEEDPRLIAELLSSLTNPREKV